MCAYRFGSLGLAYASHEINVPSIRWLGILPTDKDLVDEQSVDPLEMRDRKKIQDLLQRPYVKANDDIRQMIELMRDNNEKMRLNALSLHTFLHSYLQNKIKSHDWI